MDKLPDQVLYSTVINPVINPSLLNYVPSIIGSSFQSTFKESISDLTAHKNSTVFYPDKFIEKDTTVKTDKESNELYRAFRDEAGPWESHRFNLEEWETPPKQKAEGTEKQETGQGDESDSFDGYLTEELVGSALSKLDRCPEFNYYSYVKCVLLKKKLINIDAIKNYHYLQYVDVSRNKLTTLQPLGNLPFLKYLDASFNQLKMILDFKAPFFLTNVNLSHNKFKVMRNLSDFWSITDLNLSHNDIRVIDGLLGLRFLSTLNLSYNHIESIEHLDNLRIQFLNLQNNRIKSYDDDETAMLHTLNNIRIIILSHNQITSLKMFESVESLECLELSQNDISKLLDIYYLRNLKYLNKLNLTGNAVTNLRRYYEVCILNIRNLVYLDGEHINNDFWLQKISNRVNDVSQVGAHQRLMLLILEQLNKPQIWDWMLPYNTPPLCVIVLVGLQASRRATIAKMFCKQNEGCVVGVQYTTRPKHEEEVEGEFYYYISEAKFREMLINGEFLTFQEHLGYYYGFSHSEFRKAEQGILILNTELTMALSLKSRFLNTKLVLALPSTRKQHLENLNSLFAIQLSDRGIMKIINSPIQAKFCELHFDRERKKYIQMEIKQLVFEMVDEVIKIQETVAAVKRQSDILQLWAQEELRESVVNKSYGEYIEDMNVLNQQESVIDQTFWVSISHFRRMKDSNQMSKYVSFGDQSDNNAPKEADPTVIPQANRAQDNYESKAKEKKKGTECKRIRVEVEESHKVRSVGSNPSSYFMEHASYAEILSDDERIKQIFTGELNKREELLDLHWSMPGLFRELLFTDYVEETLEKLRQLVKDITEHNETSGKPLMNFENDQQYKKITEENLKRSFRSLEMEEFVAEKQAAEFIYKESAHICSSETCKNRTCPTN